MQNSELFERKRQESIQLKNQAKIFAEKLARKKAEEVFTDRVQPTTMFTDTKKKQFIDKITKQYEPIFYKDIINKIISQKVMEEQNKQLRYAYSQQNKKNTEVKKPVQEKVNEGKIIKQNDNGQQEIAQIIESSREVYDLFNTNNQDSRENQLPESIMQDNDDEQDEKLVMSILKKK